MSEVNMDLPMDLPLQQTIEIVKFNPLSYRYEGDILSGSVYVVLPPVNQNEVTFFEKDEPYQSVAITYHLSTDLEASAFMGWWGSTQLETEYEKWKQERNAYLAETMKNNGMLQ